MATLDCHVPKPRGANIGAIKPPITARIERFISSTIWNAPFTTPKDLRNQIRTLAARITVPARFIKLQPRSHMLLSIFIMVGAWYAGSSITKGAGSPANILVFLSIIPDTITAATPIKYAVGATHQALPNNAPAINPTIGILAPQGMKVVVMMVILRSRSFSIVLEAIIPGTPHPELISIGMNDFPERPNLRNMRSIMNATRAI